MHSIPPYIILLVKWWEQKSDLKDTQGWVCQWREDEWASATRGPRGLKGWILEAASLKPERKGPVERETLEMWERLANSYKESTEEEGCDGNWWKSFPWKGAFAFSDVGWKEEAWKEIFWGRAMSKGKSNRSLFRPAYRAYSPGRILRTHFSKPVHHPGFFQKIYGLTDSLQL